MTSNSKGILTSNLNMTNHAMRENFMTCKVIGKDAVLIKRIKGFLLSEL